LYNLLEDSSEAYPVNNEEKLNEIEELLQKQRNSIEPVENQLKKSKD